MGLFSWEVFLFLLIRRNYIRREHDNMLNENMHNKANRLANEKNPYLLKHAYNPVDWYPWGEEAFTKAKAEDKPIFLSIGYS
jgi:hypothetical protein